MEKIWLKQYPREIPADIDLTAYTSLTCWFKQICQKYHDKTAFRNVGQNLSYQEIWVLSQQLAAYLQTQMGLKKGDRVAIMMPNLLQYPIAIFAILQAGGIVVNTNPLYTPRELKHQLNDAGVKILLVAENFAHTVEKIIDQTQIQHSLITSIGDLLGIKGTLINLYLRHIKQQIPPYKQHHPRFKQALAQGKQLKLKPITLTQHDLAFLQYTGGTTGIAKGAMLSHGNLIANILQAHHWIKPALCPPQQGQDHIITALPLYHIFSLTANCFSFMHTGGINSLITDPRNLKSLIKTLKQTPFSAITGVNTLYKALLQQKEFKNIDFSQLRICLGGGTNIQPDVAQAWQQQTGRPLLEAYGMTETSPAVCINPINNRQYSGNIGLPISSTQVSIQDQQGQQLKPGQSGELCIKGPQVMQGYWQRPEETQKTIIDGWLHSGDIAIMDKHGYIKLIDRKKDMIIVSGFNVYPSEIETQILKHPDISEAAAIGLSDDRTGERVCLCVISTNPNLNAQSLRQYCKQRLTAYKVPKQIEFYQVLPKSNIGKILRRELKAQLSK